MKTISVGPYEIHTFVDGLYSAPITDITHASGATAKAEAIARWGQPTFEVDVNCFGLHGPDGLTLIDAGGGTSWGQALGKAASAIRDAGFVPAQVDAVLLTHIHTDHAMGLLDGDASRFPNATVRIPRGDLEWYGTAANLAATPEDKRSGFATIERLRSAYGVQIGAVDAGPVLPGIEAISLPGHTPGHSGYLIHDDRRALLLWGDVVHIEALQLADPGIGSRHDFDLEKALHSREVALARAAREGWYVGGGHVSGIRRMERHGDGLRLVEE